jgi:hypothetical protein
MVGAAGLAFVHLATLEGENPTSSSRGGAIVRFSPPPWETPESRGGFWVRSVWEGLDLHREPPGHPKPAQVTVASTES